MEEAGGSGSGGRDGEGGFDTDREVDKIKAVVMKARTEMLVHTK